MSETAVLLRVFGNLKRGEVKILNLEITPEEAAQVLEHFNPRNRTLDRDRVRKYARDMESESWEVNGETIIFNSKGELNDGQHRLQACVKAETPFTTAVVYGVAPETQRTVDQGASRRVSDVLQIDGVAHAPTLSATINHLVQIRQRTSTRNVRLTIAEAQGLIEREPRIQEVVEKVAGWCTAGSKLCPKGLAEAIMVAALETNAEGLVFSFFHKVLTGEGTMGLDTHEGALRDKLFSMRVMGKDIALAKRQLIINAWNSFKAGDSVKTLKVPHTGRGTVWSVPD